MNTPKMLPFSGISHEPEWEAEPEAEEIATELDPGHVCKRCEGRGYVYDSPRPYDGDVSKEDCPDCAEAACRVCGCTDLRFIAIESREPHGETCRDEGYKCVSCGAIEMRADDPPSADLIASLTRSIVLQRNLDPAFRLGVMLATLPKKTEVA